MCCYPYFKDDGEALQFGGFVVCLHIWYGLLFIFPSFVFVLLLVLREGLTV